MRIHPLLSRPVDDGVLVFDLETGSTHLLDKRSWDALMSLHQDSPVPSGHPSSAGDEAEIVESFRRGGLID